MVAPERDDETHRALALTMRLVRAVDATDPIAEALGAMRAVLGTDRASYYTRNLVDRTLKLTHSTAQAILDAAIAPQHHEGDASIAAQSLQSGRPLVRAPFRSSPDEERIIQGWGLSLMRNIASLPIVIGGIPQGVLQLINAPAAVLTGDLLPLAEVAALFAAVLESANRRQELATLGDTILRVNRSLELRDTFDAVMSGLITLVPSITAAIYLDGIEPEILVRVALHVLGKGEHYPMTQPRPLDGSLVGWVYRHRTSVNVPDLHDDPRVLRSGPDALPPETNIRSYIMVPMLAQGHPVGVLACARRGVGAYSAHDLEIVERFAPLAAQAVANARSYEEAEHGRKRMETLLEDIADAVIRTSRDSRVIGWNRGAERLLGYTADEIIGHSPPVEPIDNDTRYAGLYQRVLAGESFVNLDNRQRHRDGHYLDTIISLSPLRERGEIIGSVAFVRDITPLKQLQAQLRAEITINIRRAQDEAYIAAVAQACNSAADGPAILQALATLTAGWANAAAVVTFVGSTGTLAAYASKTREEDAPFGPHLQSYVDMLTRFLFRDGQWVVKQPGIVNLHTIPGDVPIVATAIARGYHTHAYAPIFAGGEIVGALGATARGETAPFDAQSLETLRLVAEQAGLAITKDRLLKQVEAQVRALEQASRHKDDFLASLSHELRTPLNAILGFGQMLMDEQLTDRAEVRQAVEDIVISGQLLLTQVNDLLDMARIEAGQMTLTWTDVPLSPLVRASERMIAPLIAAKQQQFTLDLPDAISPVRADAERLQQVILNLLTNAHKFTPEGGAITVRVESHDGQVVIVVQDTGIGIAPEYAEVVFEPFRRVETGYARRQGGTGLGLALCRRFVELMGGTLTLESTPGRGSTFTVTLPAAVGAQATAAVGDPGKLVMLPAD